MQTIESIRDFKGKYPKQLWYLFLSEMWERFCFYGMRGVLTVFMVERLLMDERSANLKYGAIQAFVYAMTFVGGLFADKILGFRKSIFWGGILMIIGSFTIAISPDDLFYVGTSISIVGTGFFKPNISGVVGLLYNHGDPRRDAGFGLFYSGINIGAFLGGIYCFKLGDNYGWHWAFILSGIAMIIGLLVFGLTKNTLGPLGFSPLIEKGESPVKARRSEVLVYVGSIISIPLILAMISNTNYTDLFMYIVGPAATLYIIYEMTRSTKDEMKKLAAAMVFIVFSIFFWSFFEQSGGSLALYARNHLNNEVLGITMDPNEVNNSSNSLFVIVFSPLLGLLWLWLAKRKSEPNTLVKFGLGFIFLGLAFFLYYINKNYINPGKAGMEAITSLDIFTLAYLASTIGELCLSPIGLSIMTKLSPKRLIGIMMGMWFLASAYGQYFAGLLGADMSASGKYDITEVHMDKGNGVALSTLIWNDTAKVVVNYERVNVFYNTAESDTIETTWKPVEAVENLYFKTNSKGDTIAWANANMDNDFNENVALPQSLINRNDVSIKIDPAAEEKLAAYANGYKSLSIYAFILGVILILISPLVRKLMGEVH